MLGSVYKRGEIWWIKFSYKGKPYYASSKSSRKTDAQKLLQMYLGEIAQGTFTGLKTNRRAFTVDELLNMFLWDCKQRGLRGLNKIGYRANNVRKELGDLDVAHLDEQRIERYIEERLRVVSTTTVNRETQLLGQALRLAERKKLIRDFPRIEKFREDNAREVFFERHEFDHLLPHLPHDIQDFVLFGYLTGWRMNEISQLRWSDVEEDTIRLKGEHSKNREGRFLILEGEIGDIIERRREARIDLNPFVFHRENGGQVKRFDKAWRTACKKAGVEGKYFHDFRRTATRNMRRAGVDQGTIMKITGHKTPIMFYRYNIIDEEDQRSAISRTQEHLKRDRKIIPMVTNQ